MLATMEGMPSTQIQSSNPHQSCIDLCKKCADACNECLSKCIQKSEVDARNSYIMSLQDCSEICSVSVHFMSRNSMNINEVCNICDIVCEKCVLECEKVQDQHSKTCLDACKECASECRNMAHIS